MSPWRLCFGLLCRADEEARKDASQDHADAAGVASPPVGKSLASKRPVTAGLASSPAPESIKGQATVQQEQSQSKPCSTSLREPMPQLHGHAPCERDQHAHAQASAADSMAQPTQASADPLAAAPMLSYLGRMASPFACAPGTSPAWPVVPSGSLHLQQLRELSGPPVQSSAWSSDCNALNMLLLDTATDKIHSEALAGHEVATCPAGVATLEPEESTGLGHCSRTDLVGQRMSPYRALSYSCSEHQTPYTISQPLLKPPPVPHVLRTAPGQQPLREGTNSHHTPSHRSKLPWTGGSSDRVAREPWTECGLRGGRPLQGPVSMDGVGVQAASSADAPPASSASSRSLHWAERGAGEGPSSGAPKRGGRTARPLRPAAEPDVPGAGTETVRYSESGAGSPGLGRRTSRLGSCRERVSNSRPSTSAAHKVQLLMRCGTVDSASTSATGGIGWWGDMLLCPPPAPDGADDEDGLAVDRNSMNASGSRRRTSRPLLKLAPAPVADASQRRRSLPSLWLQANGSNGNSSEGFASEPLHTLEGHAAAAQSAAVPAVRGHRSQPHQHQPPPPLSQQQLQLSPSASQHWGAASTPLRAPRAYSAGVMTAGDLRQLQSSSLDGKTQSSPTSSRGARKSLLPIRIDRSVSTALSSVETASTDPPSSVVSPSALQRLHSQGAAYPTSPGSSERFHKHQLNLAAHLVLSRRPTRTHTMLQPCPETSVARSDSSPEAAVVVDATGRDVREGCSGDGGGAVRIHHSRTDPTLGRFKVHIVVPPTGTAAGATPPDRPPAPAPSSGRASRTLRRSIDCRCGASATSGGKGCSLCDTQLAKRLEIGSKLLLQAHADIRAMRMPYARSEVERSGTGRRSFDVIAPRGSPALTPTLGGSPAGSPASSSRLVPVESSASSPSNLAQSSHSLRCRPIRIGRGGHAAGLSPNPASPTAAARAAQYGSRAGGLWIARATVD